MLSKKLLATALVGCLGFATAQADEVRPSDDVTVYFEANVIGSACVLKVSSGNHEAHESTTVNFGDVKDNTELDDMPIRQVTFKLSSCGAGVVSAIVKPDKTSATTTVQGNKLLSTSANSGSGAGSANIAFYKDSAASQAFLLDGTDTISFANKEELDDEKSIWVRLEQADTPIIGPINEHIVFTAEYY